MNNGKFCLLFVLSIFSITSLFAEDFSVGKFQKLKGGESWEQEYDFSQLPEGKYNYVIRSKDVSGLVSTTKGKNFIVTAKADKPTINIISPAPHFYATNTFLVIGSCNDNDGVVEVSLLVDDQRVETKTEKQYWSFAIDVARFTEGLHTLTVACKDRKGVEGDSVSLPFFIDKAKPKVIDAEISSKSSATWLHLNAKAFDVNGVKRIDFSLNDAPFSRINFSNKKDEEGNWAFSLGVNFKNLDSQELVIRLQDNSGRVGFWSKKIVREDATYTLFDIKDKAIADKKSLDNPEIILEEPRNVQIESGNIRFKGKVISKNSLKSVMISFDNAVSFHQVSGLENWNYQLTSKIIQDGVYPVLIRATDQVGLFTDFWTMIIIDNSAPVIDLKLPVIHKTYKGTIPIAAHIKDDNEIAYAKYSIYSVTQGSYVVKDLSMDIVNEVIQTEVNATNFTRGNYIVQIRASDIAGNSASINSPFVIEPVITSPSVDIIFPLEGKALTLPFEIEGKAEGVKEGSFVNVSINKNAIAKVEVNRDGYFSYMVEKDKVETTSSEITVTVSTGGGKAASAASKSRFYFIKDSGPYIKVSSLRTGDRFSRNFTISGEAGWIAGEGELPMGLSKIDLSFDNGITWNRARGLFHWKYRVNTIKLASDIVPILIRATFSDGTQYTCNKFFLLNTKKADIESLNFPEKNQVWGTKKIQGVVMTPNEVDTTEIMIRKNSTAFYEKPSGFQMLYLDLNALGPTYFRSALGVALMDNTIRLQLGIGASPDSFGGKDTRFYGFTAGGKILARLYEVEFGDYFGSDYDFLSLGFYMGVDVSWFSMTPLGKPVTTEDGTVLVAGLLQVELGFDVPNIPSFNHFALYGEFSLWFVSSDIFSTVIPSGSLGLKIGLL